MSFSALISSITKIFRRPAAKTVRVCGQNINYNETKIQTGASVWIWCVIVAIIVAGFVAVCAIYFITIRNTDISRACKNCHLDNDITAKMMSTIRDTPNMAENIARHSNIDLARVPDGYFAAFQRIDPLLHKILDNNLGDVVGMRPDLSVSNRFSSYAKKYYPDKYSARKSCRDLYINQDQPGATHMPLICYPMELADEFDLFFKTVYMDKYASTYIERLKKDKIKLIKEARTARDQKRARTALAVLPDP